MRIYFLFWILLILTGCKKNNPSPLISTLNVTGITNTTALCGGNITNNFGRPITARGVVWSTSPQPTISLATKTSDSIGVGSFSSKISGLAQNTLYYVRAYASSSSGTSYGNEIQFRTLNIDISSDLVVHYPFNGNANDASPNKINGTVLGMVRLTEDRLGRMNKAYLFPGNSDSYINGGTSSALHIQGSLTMAAWVYLDGGSLNPRVLSYGNEGSGTNYQISMRGTSNTSRFIDAGIAMTNGNGSFFCCGPQGNGVSIPALTWQHIAITVDHAGMARFYLNGQLSKSHQGTPVNEANYTNTVFNIGRKNLPSFDAFGGKLDEIRIYKRSLTAEQVGYLYTLDD